MPKHKIQCSCGGSAYECSCGGIICCRSSCVNSDHRCISTRATLELSLPKEEGKISLGDALCALLCMSVAAGPDHEVNRSDLLRLIDETNKVSGGMNRAYLKGIGVG